MHDQRMSTIFNEERLSRLFPKDKADSFFDALYGDANEGAYDIKLVFNGDAPDHLAFEFHLTQRPGKCLACNLTYGLPEVFQRHPVINIKHLVQEIEACLEGRIQVTDWKLLNTQELSGELHVIPLVISFKPTR
ncbi:MAG: pancreas/duodenum homeobox protein 1 [Thermodesulfobacteriota bacterium]|nr:pancreas/duodenum homeobox protein 1 [Thermodesulfobacteriota bacterium]